MSEQWKPVPGFEDRYEISDAGRCRSLDRPVTYTDGRKAMFRGRELAGARGVQGYLSVTLEGQRFLLHRLVGIVFVKRRAGADFINHVNGDKRDNRAVNLEWTDMTGNNRHARSTGLNMQHGERSNLAAYSDQLVAALRRVHQRYGPSYRELALLFDISEMQAADIVKGRTRQKG